MWFYDLSPVEGYTTSGCDVKVCDVCTEGTPERLQGMLKSREHGNLRVKRIQGELQFTQTATTLNIIIVFYEQRYYGANKCDAFT